MASSAQSTTPAVILKNVRTGNWILFFLSVANGLFLYFFPWLAEQYYAWSIKPPINAAFMGAGYIIGVVGLSLALFITNYWRSIRPTFWPFFVMCTVLFISTIIHRDNVS